MKGLFVTSPGMLDILELPTPQPGPYEALVKTEACAICNSTDTKILNGEFVSGTWPVLMGHETVGRVIKVGENVENYHIGDLVLRGSLQDRHIPFSGGRSCWGGFVEYNLVTDVWSQKGFSGTTQNHPQQTVPSGIDPVHATAMITLKENMSVISNFNVVGKSVAIIGTGPVAQAMALFSGLMGAGIVVVFGRNPEWHDRFMTLGADAYVSTDNIPLKVKHIIDGGGFDRVLEAVGSQEALSKCILLAGTEGKVGLYGIPSENAPYHESDRNNPIVTVPAVNEAEVHTQMLDLVDKGRINLADWVSACIPWTEYQEGFRLVWEKRANKVVLTF